MKLRIEKSRKSGFGELNDYDSGFPVCCESSIFNLQSSIPSGFTLLELMISLTIVGLILVLVFGSLRIGARAWEKGEKDVEIHQRQRVVLENIKRQIASIFVRKVTGDDKQPFFLKGDGETMEFISRVSMLPANRMGLVYVKYVVEAGDGSGKTRLLFSEKNVVIIEKVMEDQDVDDFYELIPGAQDIEFEYLGGGTEEDEEPVWQETWDPETDKGAPLAVKITLEGDSDTAPIHVIARIGSEAS